MGGPPCPGSKASVPRKGGPPPPLWELTILTILIFLVQGSDVNLISPDNDELIITFPFSSFVIDSSGMYKISKIF